MAATAVGLALTLTYLLIARSHPWALAMLIALGTILVTLAGRPGDAITTGVTITVVMVVAQLEPRNAWEQPILRFADTVLGVIVGVATPGLACPPCYGPRGRCRSGHRRHPTWLIPQLPGGS